MIGTPKAGGVWGWPWHGLCTGGAIGSTGKTITQPPNGAAWLIDMGLPAISLTSAETAEAAANNWTWQNYALISGGRIYDTELPSNSYIHVDEDNKCWLIALSFAYVAENQVDITASIKPFGLFGYGAYTAITKTASAICEHIEVNTASGNPVRSYDFRTISLSDVWTNGTKCLIGVWLSTTGTDFVEDLFSVIELTITGSGGSTGNDLVISASEAIAQSNLTIRISNSGTIGGINEDAPPGEGWKGVTNTGYGGGIDVVQDKDSTNTYAKHCYYNNAGVAKSTRLKTSSTEDNWLTSAPGMIYTLCDPPYAHMSYGNAYVSIAGEKTTLISILSGNDVVDELKAVESWTGRQRICSKQQLTETWYPGDPIDGELTTLCGSSFAFAYYEFSESTYQLTGDLSSYFDVAEAETISTNDFADLVQYWRGSSGHNNTIAIGDEYLGLHRIETNAAALFHTTAPSSARNYGPISTPLGVLTYSGTITDNNLFFAWQRKTGANTFATSPICYV
jgi:hypothetical protein